MKLGSNDISAVKIGSTDVNKIYIGSTEVWSSSSGFDADYQAVLDYATTQGYTLPSSGQQTLQNQLVVDLKDAGVWSKLDTFGVFATDGDSDFALIDWIRLSQYTAVNSPVFATNIGFAGDGTSAYIDTNFNPSTQGVNYTLDDAGRIMFADFPTDSSFPESAGGSYRNLTRNNNLNSRQRINQGPDLSTGFSPSNWCGSNVFRAIYRTSSTNVEMFGNTTQSSGTQTSTIIENLNQYLLQGSFAYVSSSNIFKVYGMGASLVSENTDFYNALDNYITSL